MEGKNVGVEKSGRKSEIRAIGMEYKKKDLKELGWRSCLKRLTLPDYFCFGELFYYHQKSR